MSDNVPPAALPFEPLFPPLGDDDGDDTPAIGIDLGTSFASVAVIDGGEVKCLSDEGGAVRVACCVHFGEDGRVTVGEAARAKIGVDNGVVFDALRFLGRRFDDPAVVSDAKLLPFEIVPLGDGSRVGISLRFHGEVRVFAAEEIVAFVIKKLRVLAETFLGCRVTKAVISVPAMFSYTQRQATRHAARIAGFTRLVLISHSASCAVFSVQNLMKSGDMLIFNMGGGSCEASVVNVSDDGWVQMKAISGDMSLGGIRFDTELATYFMQKTQNTRDYETEVAENSMVVGLLKVACEKAKKDLSTAENAVIKVNTKDDSVLKVKVSRIVFEKLCEDLFAKITKFINRCLRDAKVDKFGLKNVLLVGGSTGIHRVKDLLQKSLRGVNVEIEVLTDEAVAYGAAGLALRGKSLRDITPLSIGVDSPGGFVTTLFPRNTNLPSRSTTRTYQETQVIFVFEGESCLQRDNEVLGSVDLANYPPTAVTFSLDDWGILAAVCGPAPEQQELMLQNERWLSEEDVENMTLQANINQ